MYFFLNYYYLIIPGPDVTSQGPSSFTTGNITPGQDLLSKSQGVTGEVISTQSTRRSIAGLAVGGAVGVLLAVGLAVCALLAGIIIIVSLKKKGQKKFSI